MTDMFTSMLAPWQWLLMCLVPPAIVALYFLKLRRMPLEVPSTYLWRRTIEDMHVNSLWQRLRQNLLLFLQLLLIALLMLACLRPSWIGRKKLQNRLIFLVDASASMTATDETPTRMDVAKQRVNALIEQMDPGDAAMVISFSDRAKVEQPFTTNKRLLRDRLAQIKPTQRTSDVSEALRVAAGLANPGRSGDTSAGDVAAADAMPADVFVLSDGGFKSVPEFSWGNLNPVYIPIGKASAKNLAIAAFSAQPNPNRPDRMEAFAEVENFSGEDVTIELTLNLNDTLLDASQIAIPAGETKGTSFSFEKIDEGILKVGITEEDDLSADNVAFAAINRARRARVLLVTPGNDALELAFGTGSATKLADVTAMDPGGLAAEEHITEASEGKFDLIIYDRCAPEKMPRCNTLFLASKPPVETWTAGEAIAGPTIIDVEVAHPMMKYLAFGDVRIVNAVPMEGPLGTQILIDSDSGPLLSIAPREGFEDAVMGFAILTASESGEISPNTDWPIRASFPLFCKNMLEYLAGAGGSNDQLTVLPGAPVPLRLDGAGDTINVTSPQGVREKVTRDRNNTYVYTNTDSVGVYDVGLKSGDTKKRFSVNLFDKTESTIIPQEAFETAWNRVEAETTFETTRRDAWRWILVLAIIVLVAEWYIYNRRVYL
jgi:hypothetical protein